MKILAFDTSSDRLSIALYEDGRKKALYESESAGRHSETLVARLQKILKSAKLTAKSIDCFAVGVGPGSFTGLRIGVTAAKMLAYAAGAKIIGISSLEAAARRQECDGLYAVMADARRSQVYAAVYGRRGGKWRTLKKPGLFFREDFLRLVGTSAKVIEGEAPSAQGIAEAAAERAAAGKFDDIFKLSPEYLRPKDCNVTKK